MSGKGSRARPLSVDHATFDANWDMIFRKEHAVIEEVSKLIAEETLQETDNRITDHSKRGSVIRHRA
jgi:hypothetical protein